MPVTGGFSRSVVNFDAGAETPAAGAYAAVGIAMATLFLTPAIAYLPQATLAATIIVAVLSLVDLSILKKTWNYAKSDFIAVATTLLVTLGLGVETGVACGVFASLALHLYKTSKPHMAVVGEVGGLEPMTDSEAVALARALTGGNAVDVVSFGTEAGLFQDVGIPTVVCGPGSIDQAHKPDEFVSLEQLG